MSNLLSGKIAVFSLVFLVAASLTLGASQSNPIVIGEKGINLKDEAITNIDWTNSDTSGLSSSDVGLANVENEDSLALDGTDSMSGDIDLNGNNIDGLNSVTDSSGDQVLSVNDNQNSVEMSGGFKLPTGTDAYN